MSLQEHESTSSSLGVSVCSLPQTYRWYTDMVPGVSELGDGGMLTLHLSI